MRLAKASEVPPYVRTRYVLSGYRPLDSSCEKWSTIFRLHNETANVWSSLLSFGWIVRRMLETSGETHGDATARLCLTIFHCGSALCFGSSAIAHALAGLQPPARSRQLWHMDLLGICCCLGGSIVPGIWWGFRCQRMTHLLYAAILILCTAASFRLTGAPLGSKRNQLFTAVVSCTAAFCLLPVVHWWGFVSTSLERADILPETLMMFGCYLVGFCFYKFCPLERMWPGGPFDFVGSHFVWHVACAAAVAYWDRACMSMMRHYGINRGCPNS